MTAVNDAPVVVTAQTTGAVTEDVAVDPHGQLHVSGTIDFIDVDLSDTHFVAAGLVSSTGHAGGIALGTLSPRN